MDRTILNMKYTTVINRLTIFITDGGAGAGDARP